MATLLPPGKLQFCDSDGKPLAGGTVDFFVPGTSDRKNTWQDSATTILNTNPVVLDSAGEAVIFGVGIYRQVVTDAAGNLVWDQETSDGTSATGDITVSGSIAVSGDATIGGNGTFGSLTSGFIDAGTGSVQAGFITSTTVQTGTLNVSGDATLVGDFGANNITAGGTLGASTISVSGTFSGNTSGWQLTPTGTGAFSGDFNLGIASGGGVLGTTFIAASDARVKTGIEDVSLRDSYRFISDLKAKTFLKDGAPDAGFIAQDAILNGFQRMVVVTNTDDPRMSHGDDISPPGKRLNLNYNHAIAYHHRMLAYLMSEVQALRERVVALEGGKA